MKARTVIKSKMKSTTITVTTVVDEVPATPTISEVAAVGSGLVVSSVVWL